ncbi:MAG: hypothetical protein ACO294_09945 [Methylococcales bacterium]
MKKLLTTLFLIAATFTASAVEVGISEVHDYGVKKNGYRASVEVAGINLTGTHMGHSYNRLTVGKDFQVFKFGNATFYAGASAAYQNTLVSNVANGYGAVADVKADLVVSKNINLTLGAEHFGGRNQIKQFNGNAVNIGLEYKF